MKLMREDISVLVGSCDKYSFLWNDFEKLFNKYWKLNTHNILVSETKKLDADNFTSVTCNSNLWGTRILDALNNVKTKYVFFMLEDYFFHSEINDDMISWHTNYLDEVDGNKILIAESSPRAYSLQPIGDSLYKFSDNSDYLTSLQPGIWKTDWLRSIINENYDPWQFEVEGTNSIKGKDNRVYINTQPNPIYYNVIRKQKYIPEVWGQLKWNDFKMKEDLLDLENYIKSLQK